MVPLAVCCDNTTVSGTNLGRESALAAELLGWDAVREIHRAAGRHSFLASTTPLGQSPAVPAS